MAEVKLPTSYKIQIRVLEDDSWIDNTLRFATKGDAEAYGRNLSYTWITPDLWQAVPTDDAPTHEWKEGQAVQL